VFGGHRPPLQFKSEKFAVEFRILTFDDNQQIPATPTRSTSAERSFPIFLFLTLNNQLSILSRFM
jgi:hypothetical protein